MIRNSFLALSAVAIFSCPLVASAGEEHDHPHAKVGHKAPPFTLKDTHGEIHELAKYTADGKIVVLEWFNHGCPVCAHHAAEGTIIKMVEQYKDKDVVFLGIDSTHFHDGKTEEINTKIKEWKLNYTILTDFDGKVGHMMNAKTTPHMFIINKDGILVYDGAIDNAKTGDGKTNHVTVALDQLLAGQTVETSKTAPYGCSVKYKKK